MRTVRLKVYTFFELHLNAKKKAIEDYRRAQADFSDWSTWTIDDAKNVGGLLGIEIKDIYWSDFYSQGAGACFEGTYKSIPNVLAIVKAQCPQDEKLHKIAAILDDLSPYGITANISHSGGYNYNDNCVDIETEFATAPTYHDPTELQFQSCMRAYMRLIFQNLQAEFEYRDSDAAIIESIEANEYEFLNDGTVFIEKVN